MGSRHIEDQLTSEVSINRVIPYITVGFPTIEATVNIVHALEQAGASVIELGVPFSDPIADGPVIQRAGFHALQNGISLTDCFSVVRRLRKEGLSIPLVLMGYYNCFLAYGLEETCSAASMHGVDGFIIPDLPFEEVGIFLNFCEKYELALIPLVSLTSTNDRLKQSCSYARGFVYCVSLLGVTGVRNQVSADVKNLVQQIRNHTKIPVAVGFGISKPQHVREISQYADAVVVGSALLSAIDNATLGEEGIIAGQLISSFSTILSDDAMEV
jgi:tryptophan synthase alpha chain